MWYIFRFFLEKKVSGISVFFCVILGRPGRSTVWAHMQSVRACAVETHFSIFVHFLKTTPTSVHFGFILGTIFIENLDFVRKKECQQKGMQKVPAHVDPGSAIALSRSSLTAPLACALFQQETRVRATIAGIVARTRFFLEICFILLGIMFSFLQNCSTK